tara:strand:- start:492 stop:1196 length:705 start_codon:yes stop_codon:yes gene_type:complete
MNNENNFETFLYYSDKRLSISVQQSDKDSKFYEKSVLLDENLNNLHLDKFNEFLNSNIFKIEKSLKKFIKNITLIIDHKELFKITLSLKKKIYGNPLNNDSLSSLLKDARNQIKENYNDKIITHMIVDKYLIDGKYFSNLPEKIKCENVCVDLYFICLSEDFIKKFEQIFSKYQIKIKQILSADYIKDCFKDDEIDIFSMCKKIIQGHNKNEILLVPKKIKNKGFFEKFFNFFS